MKVGSVSIVGRPNVGKSTLLNSILNMKLAIISNKAGTTRNLINGIYNDDDSQIIFVDTPGINKPLNKLENLMNRKSYSSVDDVDLVLFLIDAKTGIGKKDEQVLNKLKDLDIPVFLVINKIDGMKNDDIFKVIVKAKDIYPFKEVIPISAKNKKNIDELLNTIKTYLEEQDKIYSEDELTNVSLRFIMAEFVREKVLELTRDEIPYTVTCYTENFEEYDDIVNISVLIVIERENLKKILIGKKGSMLKEIGTRARYDMENFLGKKVFLETHVKTLKNWRDEEKYFSELGLEDE
ncbi:MAG: GTPase Era [Bacilli bacterium]|nr:GTPase Era [Bacilli bacterium]